MSHIEMKGTGGGGGGMAIGDPVTGGTSKSVLFIDGSGNLAQANVDFNFDPAIPLFTTKAAIADTSYDYETPVDGATINIPNGVYTVIVDPATTLNSLTMELPNAPRNGQIVRVKFTQSIVSLNFHATGSGNSVNQWADPQTPFLGSSLDCQFKGTTGSGTWFVSTSVSAAPNIGQFVNFGTPQGVLFIDTNQNLAEDTTNFFWDFGTNILHVANIITNSLSSNGSIVDLSYGVDTPSSGDTINIPNGVYTEIIDPTGTLATLTVVLPTVPVNGQILRLKFTHIITALTISSGADTVKGAPTTVALGGMIDCQFTGTAGSGTWYC